MARKVLVADDSVTIQKVVGLTFANEDIELSFVDNGEEALTLARRIKPDLIMADVLMPGKSGYEVCESVKADPELQHIPVLLLTGTFEPFDADRCAQVGANGTITKPFESQTLIREVRELLDRPVSAKTPATEQPAGAEAAVEAPVDPMQEVPVELSPEPAPEPAWPEEEVPAEPGPAWTQPEAQDTPGPSWTQPAAARETAPPDAGPVVSPPPVQDEGVADSPAFEANIAGEETQDWGAEEDAPLAFSREPDLALNREEMDAPQTPEEGAPASWTEAPSPDTPAAQPPAGQPAPTPANEDVWDLSDFESVDESQIEPLPEDALVEESETLWNEAAAEAIDLVETTNLEADNETAAGTNAAPPLAPDASPGGAPPEAPAPAEGGFESIPADQGLDTPIGSGLIEGETEFEAFDLGPDGQGEPLEVDVPAVDEPHADPGAGAEPGDSPAGVTPAVEELPSAEAVLAADEPSVLVPEEGGCEDLSIEALPESPVDAPPAPAPDSVAAASPAPGTGNDLAALTGLPADKSTAIVSEAVKDAVEKFTWEAFGDLPETVVRAVQEKVEKIAWEVIPQMAETIIKEEIRRLKDEGK